MDTLNSTTVTTIRARKCGHMLANGEPNLMERLATVYKDRGLDITISHERPTKASASGFFTIKTCEVCE